MPRPQGHVPGDARCTGATIESPCMSGSSHHEVSRVGLAILIVIALSMASASLWRWLPDLQFIPRSWPALYPAMIGSLLGAFLFVHNVIRPLSVEHSHRRQLCIALAPLGAFATWALASALWSSSPASTPMDALLMTFVLATSVWFGFALSFYQQVPRSSLRSTCSCSYRLCCHSHNDRPDSGTARGWVCSPIRTCSARLRPSASLPRADSERGPVRW